MSLEKITFTGVDHKTILPVLYSLEHQYRKYIDIEFGILVGTETSENIDKGIFPSLSFVRHFADFCKDYNIDTALHLCGNWSRSVLKHENTREMTDILKLCNMFTRTQVNLHGDTFNPKYMDVNVKAIEEFVEQPELAIVILQHRDEWDKVPTYHPDIEYLFDRSGGAGVAAFDEWPIPKDDEFVRYGYAGGIGPDNIKEACEFVKKYPNSRLMFDMEGKIRTDGYFDPYKVMKVLDGVVESNAWCG